MSDQYGKLYLDVINEVYIGYCQVRRSRFVIKWSDLLEAYIEQPDNFYLFSKEVQKKEIMRVDYMGGVSIEISTILIEKINDNFFHMMKGITG